jgi:hypothetical protein
MPVGYKQITIGYAPLRFLKELSSEIENLRPPVQIGMSGRMTLRPKR